MKASYINLLDSATLTPSSELVGNEAALLQNQLLTKQWWATTSADQTLIIDLGSAQSVDLIAILGHNLPVTSVITVEGNATNSWGSPTYSKVLTWNSGIIAEFISQSFRYFRLRFQTLVTGLEIGRIWLGHNSFTFLQGSTMGASPTKVRSDTVAYGKARQKYASVGLTWRRIALDFPPTKTTTLLNVLAMYNYSGIHSAILFFMLDTTRGYELFEPLYCTITTPELKFTHDLYLRQKYSMILEECL